MDRIGVAVYYPLVHPYRRVVVRHPQRVHTLDVHCTSPRLSSLPISSLPTIVNLRHYYAKGRFKQI